MYFPFSETSLKASTFFLTVSHHAAIPANQLTNDIAVKPNKAIFKTLVDVATLSNALAVPVDFAVVISILVVTYANFCAKFILEPAVKAIT